MRYVTRKHFNLVLLGLLLTSPFFILEAVTTAGFTISGFPAVLFISMLVMTTVFMEVLLSVYQDIRIDQARSKPFLFIMKLAVLGWLGSSLAYLVLDQWPCFLGATGC